MADLDPALVEQAAKAILAHSSWAAPKTYDGPWTCCCGLPVDDQATGVNIVTRHYEHLARAVLEAVARAIRAQALRDAADELARRVHTDLDSIPQALAILRDRADVASWPTDQIEKENR